jgi:MHS family proline/betaine transporter-like MFS transporter
MATMLITIYPAARLADTIGRKRVLLMAIVAMLLLTYPVFMMMQSGVFMQVLLAQSILAMILGWYLGPIPATLVEMFPTSIRYTGMSLAYNLCAILGGFTPSLAEWMIRSTGSNLSIMWLMIGAGIASLVSILMYKDRWKDPLPA